MRVFFMDEARFGQQGTLTKIWAGVGTRPRELQAPHMSTGTMNVCLRMLSDGLKAKNRAVPNMDQAGWHKSRGLKLPEHITVLLLASYSPELHPAERLWANCAATP